MKRRLPTLVQILILALIAPPLLPACGPVPTAAPATYPSTVSAAGDPLSEAAAYQTVVPSATSISMHITRSTAPKDLILSTTTSTQDSGLLDALIPRFEQQSGYHVKTVAVGSGAAIALGQRGEADVVLAHAPEHELKLVASGAGINRQMVMYNDFILAGPPAEPAKVQGTHDVLDALRAIAATKATFVSRGDTSGTHQLEQKLWKSAEVTPQGQAWYVESGTGMGQTLQIADQRTAYTISDRATFLTSKQRIALGIVVEGDPRLLNAYHVIAINPERFPQINKDGAEALVAFLLAPETQRMIGEFGQDTFGQALFTPCAKNSCHLQSADG